AAVPARRRGVRPPPAGPGALRARRREPAGAHSGGVLAAREPAALLPRRLPGLLRARRRAGAESCRPRRLAGGLARARDPADALLHDVAVGRLSLLRRIRITPLQTLLAVLGFSVFCRTFRLRQPDQAVIF